MSDREAQTVKPPGCRFCGTELKESFADLGSSPPCESFVPADRDNAPEVFYPLHAWVCSACFLVQLEEYVSPEEIFTEYAYFSSYSDSWLRHASAYTDEMTQRFGLDATKQIVEVASNDGYLLQYFVEKGIPVLGIEPASNCAAAAEKKGVESIVAFFGRETATRLVAEGRRADLLLGNNVLAHVPDINDFVAGMKILLSAGGVITMEFPHLMRLVEENQFDTIYHEHFSYLSFTTVERVFAHHGLVLFDVEELATHGGSIRIYARHADDCARPVEERVAELRSREAAAGMLELPYYAAFGARVRETKSKLLEFLIAQRRRGKTVAGYGAPGKGNTLLNYCGIGTDFLEFTVDRNPYKHGRYLPGTHIPVRPVEALARRQPDVVLILPWNLREELVEQLAYVRDWGGICIVPIPRVEVVLS
jgi:hypothetical protein